MAKTGFLICFWLVPTRPGWLSEPGVTLVPVKGVSSLPPGNRANARGKTVSNQMKIHQHNRLHFPNAANLEIMLNCVPRIKVSSIMTNTVLFISNHTFTTHLQHESLEFVEMYFDNQITASNKSETKYPSYSSQWYSQTLLTTLNRGLPVNLEEHSCHYCKCNNSMDDFGVH